MSQQQGNPIASAEYYFDLVETAATAKAKALIDYTSNKRNVGRSRMTRNMVHFGPNGAVIDDPEPKEGLDIPLLNDRLERLGETTTGLGFHGDPKHPISDKDYKRLQINEDLYTLIFAHNRASNVPFLAAHLANQYAFLKIKSTTRDSTNPFELLRSRTTQLPLGQNGQPEQNQNVNADERFTE